MYTKHCFSPGILCAKDEWLRASGVHVRARMRKHDSLQLTIVKQRQATQNKYVLQRKQQLWSPADCGR